MGLPALAVGIVLLCTGVGDKAVMLTLVAWGAFCTAYLLLDNWWAKLLGQVDDEDIDSDPVRETEGLRTGAATVVQTAGVVLGLVAALATSLTPAIRTGSLALVLSLLITLILYGWLIAPLPSITAESVKVHVLIRYLFNAALMTLGFGLIAVGMSIAVGR